MPERDDTDNDRTDRDLLDVQTLPILGLSLRSILAVAIGGALGSVARYLLGATHTIAPGHLPWVTLTVNLSGSFLIGCILPLTDRFAGTLPNARSFLVVGVLGGWTTYSTFAVDTTLLLHHGAYATCALYVVITLVGGLALVVIGHAMGKRLAAP
jgi:CrcB protein